MNYALAQKLCVLLLCNMYRPHLYLYASYRQVPMTILAAMMQFPSQYQLLLKSINTRQQSECFINTTHKVHQKNNSTLQCMDRNI